MILSARLVRKPRRQRYCDDCGKIITANMIRLYGAPNIGEKPYVLLAHVECINDDPDPKIRAALAKAVTA